ncbi:MAG: hypothetical protein ACRCYY_17090 [Trueperaceae bacterium]
MTKLLFCFITLTFALNSVAQEATAPVILSSGQTVAVDDVGEVYVAGFVLTEQPGKKARDDDRFEKSIYLTKFSAEGEQRWLKPIATPEAVEVVNMRVTSTGNLYIFGTTEASLDGENQGKTDAFVAKIDASGEQVWLRQFGTSRRDAATAITLAGEDIVLAGHTYSTASEKGELLWPDRSLEEDYIFLTKINAAGDVQWFRESQVSEDRYLGIGDIEVDARGNIFTTGWASEKLFPKDPIGSDAYIARFDKEGRHLWIEVFDAVMNNSGHGLGVGEDKVFITGTTGDEDMGERDYEIPRNISVDAFLANYNYKGNKYWIKQFGAQEGYVGKDIVVDDSGEIIVVGAGNGIIGGESLGASDVFIAKYSIEGKQIWSGNFGTEKFDSPIAITFQDEYVYLTGYLDLDDVFELQFHPLVGQVSFLIKYTLEGEQVWLRTFEGQTIR